jgi:hypothetical protein
LNSEALIARLMVARTVDINTRFHQDASTEFAAPRTERRADPLQNRRLVRQPGAVSQPPEAVRQR